MGYGLEIGKGTPILTGQYKIVFGGLKDAEAVTGLTYLANAFLWFLLSSYNSSTKIGANLKKRLRDGILYTRNLETTAIEIQDDVKDAEDRFKMIQAEAINLTKEQTLERVRIINIDINKGTGVITIDMNIYNTLGQKAGVRV